MNNIGGIKKKYIIPIIIIEEIEKNNILYSSNYNDKGYEDIEDGCTCGCYTRDYKPINIGCDGCPHCKHTNRPAHICY